jgi:hypothetical protein
MGRLLVLVEGDTEERFVGDVLAGYLTGNGYWSVSARQIGPSRERSRRGGVPTWGRAKREIIKLLSEDRNLILTTMFDYYGMPSDEDTLWPGREIAATASFDAKLTTLHGAVSDAIAIEMGNGFDRRRFIANILLHEFEALLFSDCATFARAIGRLDIEPQLSAIRRSFETPEHINDSPATAPSKQIAALVPGYQKPSQGLAAAQAIGVETMSRECRFFRDWLERLVFARQGLA